ncbi:unnamed protein product [Medioppia subpectinata]|uniref:non-specific serine/threonine protein kinase n=1 Tax=Medioppia subpectinata TaxID=1979941 RepID=A0A7R9L2I0_9ACAR|nr:unnamed protein product [Medioppia subpectinata]CAG2114093.1 unnamed protein product [Medioppia subpectinata]
MQLLTLNSQSQSIYIINVITGKPLTGTQKPGQSVQLLGQSIGDILVFKCFKVWTKTQVNDKRKPNVHQLLLQHILSCESGLVGGHQHETIPDNELSKSFFAANFEQLLHIGSGGFGDVYKVKHNIEQEIYAVKVIKLLELLESVQYLHNSCPPVIHRDLKPANVLISQNNNNNRFIKLCDFGLATDHKKTSIGHTSNVGTHAYMAPELHQRRYNNKVDIYSLGVIAMNLFELFDSENPMEMYNSTIFLTNFSKLFEIIGQMFQSMPFNRPTSGRVLDDYNYWSVDRQMITENNKQFNETLIRLKTNGNKFFHICGFHHSLVVTGDDCVYGWGLNSDGQTGCGEQKSGVIITPIKIQFINNGIEYKIRGVYCSRHSSFAVTTDGRVFSWGLNECHLGHNISDYIKITLN